EEEQQGGEDRDRLRDPGQRKARVVHLLYRDVDVLRQPPLAGQLEGVRQGRRQRDGHENDAEKLQADTHPCLHPWTWPCRAGPRAGRQVPPARSGSNSTARNGCRPDSPRTILHPGREECHPCLSRFTPCRMPRSRACSPCPTPSSPPCVPGAWSSIASRDFRAASASRTRSPARPSCCSTTSTSRRSRLTARATPFSSGSTPSRRSRRPARSRPCWRA